MFHQLAPYFGYLATGLLAIGLAVNNDLKFRWLNSAGCIAFIIYGIILQAMPVILTNVLLVTINFYYLFKIYRHRELFDLVGFNDGGPLVDRFISFYTTDIQAFFPLFSRKQLEGNLNFVVLRDLVIANMFSAIIHENGDAEILLNYTVPKYRDYKVGRFIFEKEKNYLLSKGVKRIVYREVANRNHEKFLRVMGFKRDGEEYKYVKEL